MASYVLQPRLPLVLPRVLSPKKRSRLLNVCPLNRDGFTAESPCRIRQNNCRGFVLFRTGPPTPDTSGCLDVIAIATTAVEIKKKEGELKKK